MAIDTEKVKETNLYTFEAPPLDIRPPKQDETGVIVGAIAACIIIMAVLLFLWKMLQRKQNEMRSMQSDLENISKKNSSEPDQSSIGKIGKASDIDKNYFDERHPWKEIDLPHSTVKAENDFDDVLDTEDQLDELILPPLSPVESSTWSQKEEMASADTGYNSGFCRKHGVLKRRFKDHADALYMEHPRNIIKSLKDDRKTIREERAIKKQRFQSAIRILRSCQTLLQSAQEKISSKCNRDLDAVKLLKQTREARKRHESRRYQSYKWHALRQSADNEKEAFVLMQDWFDGLRLHTNIHQIAEEIFLLRSEHRSDLDKNEQVKKICKESLIYLRRTDESVVRAKTMVKELQDQASKVLKSKQLTNEDELLHKNCQQTLLLKREESKNDQTSRIRVTLRKLDTHQETETSQDTSNTETLLSNKKRSSMEINYDRCNSCHRQQPCWCFQKINREVQDSKTKIDEEDKPTCDSIINKLPFERKTNPLSPLINRFKKSSTTVQPCKEVLTKSQGISQVGILTLTLLELPDESTLVSSDVSQLSEREVRKALQRVPNITEMKSITKGHDNNWTILASSSHDRIANVRFNCRGKSYILKMKSSE